MNLNFETILDFYTYKNKKILCRIRVIHSESYELKNSLRCLTQEEWNKFDKRLEKLLSNADIWKDDRSHTFKIKPYIEVKVEKSSLSARKFHKCLGAIGEEEQDEADYMLECLFHIQSEVQINSPIEKEQEYIPEIVGSPDKSLSYEPYTPSKKKYRFDNVDTIKTPGIDFLKNYDNDDLCAPENLSEISKDDPLFSEEYPASITATTRSLRRSSKSSNSDLLNEVIVEASDEIEFSQKCKSSSSKIKSEYIPETPEFPSALEDITHRKPRKRCNTVDQIFTLSEVNTKENVEKYRHCEKKQHKKRSKSIDEIQTKFPEIIEKSSKLLKLIPEENYNKPLESIKVNKTSKSKETNEITSSTKSKSQSEKHESRSSLLSEDEKLAMYKKSKNKTLKTSDDEFEEGNKLNKNIQLKDLNDNASNLNITISSATESATDTSPSKEKRRRKPKENKTTDALKPIRRSERSPTKPKRFIEEQPDPFEKKHKLKKIKTSTTNKELFGTDAEDDDEDDEYFEKNNVTKTKNESKQIKSPSIFETPINKKSSKCLLSSSSSSSKKKRKRDKSSECEQEKRDLNNWLSKKKSSSADKETEKTSKEKSKSSSSKSSKKEKHRNAAVNTESRSNSPSVFEMPSKEELESIRNYSKLKQKENAKVRAELEKLRTSPPKEVEILSLQNMSMNDILGTFLTYKTDLDEVYENNRKRDYIKGHDGINHCFVIRLLQPNIQMKMLEKLTEIYSNTKSTTQATLFANALLPEWVMRVYMEKFKFTRQEAINQIKAQEEFQLHMEEQNDNSFMFD